MGSEPVKVVVEHINQTSFGSDSSAQYKMSRVRTNESEFSEATIE